jgi:hypothetical protein
MGADRADGIGYTRQKTGVPVDVEIATELRQALAAAPRDHVTVINTEFGKPFTINGFSALLRRWIDKIGF